MLLHGGRKCKVQDCSTSELEWDYTRLQARMKYTEQAFTLWWKKWLEQVWDSLVPVAKWRKEKKNLQPGDIVLVKTVPAVGKPSTKLARVDEVFPDQHGNVRDVTVISYPKQRKEKPGPYQPGQMDVQKLPVQRLVLMIPASEISSLEPADPDLHLCDEEMRVPSDLHSNTITKPGLEAGLAESETHNRRVHALLTAASKDDRERSCWKCEVRAKVSHCQLHY